MSRVRRDLLTLFLLSLAVRLGVAVLISRPGYMDTAYYAAGAVRLARSGGLSEPFLWNYLDNPVGLPHPGFLYWMVLPSLLAAPFAVLFPGSFLALQLPFAILSALLPLIAYVVSWMSRATSPEQGRRRAWLAGLLTLFSGFFFPYWTLPESFAPFALFGGLALLLVGVWGKGTSPASRLLPLASGVLVGLAHLTRADGILLLPVVALAPLVAHPRQQDPRHAHWSLPRRSSPHRSLFHWSSPHRSLFHWSLPHWSLFHWSLPRRSSPRRSLSHWSLPHWSLPHWSLFIVLGYLLVMMPWFLRNWSVAGGPLSPAGTKTLWLATYDDLFCYRCDLSFHSYLAWGWSNILSSKLQALGVNLERFLAEDCLVFMFPLVLIGFYRLRRRPMFILAFAYLSLAYLAHSLAFTFPGPRGGFFHASAPALPFLLAAGAEGLEVAVDWAGRRRRWNLRQARAFFAAAAVALAVGLSTYVTAAKLPAWRDADAVYLETGSWLAQRGEPQAVVMVANPPAFWYHTGHCAVVVPNGDVDVLLAAADRYGARYVLLDRNRPRPLAPLYDGQAPNPRLRSVARWGDVILYVVVP